MARRGKTEDSRVTTYDRISSRDSSPETGADDFTLFPNIMPYEVRRFPIGTADGRFGD